MPSRCVAAGCSNTSSESVSVYKFPKQETLLKQWTKQVQRTRANWVPTASSTLCSKHFEADCFEETPQYKKVLKPNAIPTIFKRSLVGTSETETPSTSTDEPDEEINPTTILTDIKSFRQDNKQQLREIKEEISKAKIRLDEAEERIVNAEERLQSMEEVMEELVKLQSQLETQSDQEGRARRNNIRIYSVAEGSENKSPSMIQFVKS
uniref:THAP-type domain-containing protein n=1 Tax=Oryzias latipes TaxID=8090 RepID=A0A3B3I4U7_ORYLA